MMNTDSLKKDVELWEQKHCQLSGSKNKVDMYSEGRYSAASDPLSYFWGIQYSVKKALKVGAEVKIQGEISWML